MQNDELIPQVNAEGDFIAEDAKSNQMLKEEKDSYSNYEEMMIERDIKKARYITVIVVCCIIAIVLIAIKLSNSQIASEEFKTQLAIECIKAHGTWNNGTCLQVNLEVMPIPEEMQ